MLSKGEAWRSENLQLSLWWFSMSALMQGILTGDFSSELMLISGSSDRAVETTEDWIILASNMEF